MTLAERKQHLTRLCGEKESIYRGPIQLWRELQRAYGDGAPANRVAVQLWLKRGNVPPERALQVCALPDVLKAGIKPRHICKQLAVPKPNP